MSPGQEPLVTCSLSSTMGKVFWPSVLDLLLNPRETSQKFLRKLTSN